MSERTIRGDDDGRGGHTVRTGVVAMVTGGSTGSGREIASALSDWGWAIVIVYLDDQSRADAAVAGMLAAEGNVVAVRADLADDLDVERLFAESGAAFGGVDVVVHTTGGTASLLFQEAAQHVRSRGVIVSLHGVESVVPAIAAQLRDRGISVGRAPPREVLSFLDSWRREPAG